MLSDRGFATLFLVAWIGLACLGPAAADEISAASLQTPHWSGGVIALPDFASQTRAVWSHDAVTTRVASALKAPE